MTIYYCDVTSGSDANDGLTTSTPKQNPNSAIALASNGDEVRIMETAAASAVGSGNFTWTYNSQFVNTASSQVGTIASGDLIGIPTCAGNGAENGYYLVQTVTTTYIQLAGKYCGTTTTTSGCKKVVPVATGTSAVDIIDQPTASVTISGGWDATYTTQSGETWMKHNFAYTTSSNGGIFNTSGNACNYDRINITQAYRGYYSATPVETLSNCSFVGTQEEAIYLANGADNTTFTNVNCGPEYTGTNGTVTVANGSTYDMSTVYIRSRAGNPNIFTSTSNVTIIGGVYQCSNTYNIYIYNNNNVVLDGVTSRYGTYGVSVRSGADNFWIKDSTFYNNTRDIYVGTNIGGGRITNCTCTNSTYGIYLQTTTGILVEDCDFTGGTYQVYNDAGSGTNTFVNCTFTTPSTYAFYGFANSGAVKIKKCSIDAPSITKAYNVIDEFMFFSPMWILQDSFGQTGKVYTNYSVMKDTTTLSTDGHPTIKISTPNTIAANYADFLVGATFAKSSTAYTISYDLRANGAWSGTITPKLKLNGITIVTGTDITSVSNGSWDSKTISATTGEITEDGELTLELQITGNTVNINVGDFEVS